MDFLSGDGGDPVVVFVVVQYWDARGFSRSGDEEIWAADGAVVQPSFVGELLVDVKCSLPLSGTDRAAPKRLKLAAHAGELGSVAGAVEQLEADHVAGRHLALDDRFVEYAAQLTADSASPHPGAAIGQLHFGELPRSAQLLKGGRIQVSEVALREPFACGTINDRA